MTDDINKLVSDLATTCVKLTMASQIIMQMTNNFYAPSTIRNKIDSLKDNWNRLEGIRNESTAQELLDYLSWADDVNYIALLHDNPDTDLASLSPSKKFL